MGTRQATLFDKEHEKHIFKNFFIWNMASNRQYKEDGSHANILTNHHFVENQKKKSEKKSWNFVRPAG